MSFHSIFWLADLQKCTDTQGITRQVLAFTYDSCCSASSQQPFQLTYVLLCTAALALVKKQNARKAAVYNISKQFCNRVEPALKREINPLFITLQTAALSAQVMGCSQDTATTISLLCLTTCLILVHAGCGLEL